MKIKKKIWPENFEKILHGKKIQKLKNILGGILRKK